MVSFCVILFGLHLVWTCAAFSILGQVLIMFKVCDHQRWLSLLVTSHSCECSFFSALRNVLTVMWLWHHQCVPVHHGGTRVRAHLQPSWVHLLFRRHQSWLLILSLLLCLQSSWHSCEGKGEGISELEAWTLPEGDGPEMEMQASGFFLFFFVMWQLLWGLGFVPVPWNEMLPAPCAPWGLRSDCCWLILAGCRVTKDAALP